MFKILITRHMLDQDKEYISDGLKSTVGDCFLLEPNTFDEDTLVREIVDTDVVLGSYVTPKMLEAAKQLKLIQVPWTGMDTFDFSATRGFDIPICNSHSNADAVAELGVSLTLDLIKKVSYHDRKMRVGNWNRRQQPLNLKSGMVKGSVICMLGCGNIGFP